MKNFIVLAVSILVLMSVVAIYFMNTPNKVTGTPERQITDYSELQNFAHFFHQDITLEFGNLKNAAQYYLELMTLPAKDILKSELAAFLLETQGDDDYAMRVKWLEMGAHGHQKGIILRDFLEEIRVDL